MVEKRYWLMKSEPSAYSFDDLKRDGDSEWDGVRNYQARNNMQAMKKGDAILFYHSQSKPNVIVGTAVVVNEAYPDYTAWDPNSDHPDPKSTPEKPIWYMVDIRAEEEFLHPITLQEVKSTPALSNMVLVKTSRLSVQPVNSDEWNIITQMGRA